MQSRQEILLGLSISLTGRFSAQGRQALDGLRLWQSYVNGRDGITLGQNGPRRVRVVFYDDQSLASLARENALRLLRQDRVDALFGPYSSGLTMTVAEVAHEQKRALWNHGGSSDEIFNRGWWHLVSTPTPASEYLRDLPRCLERTGTCSAQDLYRVLHSWPFRLSCSPGIRASGNLRIFGPAHALFGT